MSAGPGASLDAEVTHVLTMAHRTSIDGSPCEIAGFFAYALATTAANVGGAEPLLAGSSGPWESSVVLVEGTVGDLQGLLRLRTEPSVVTLNGAEILEGLDLPPGVLTVDEAIYPCEERSQDDDRPVNNSPKLIDAITRIDEPHASEFVAYTERFTTAVIAAAVEIGGPALYVLVEPDTDPQNSWRLRDATVNTPTSIDREDFAHEPSLTTFDHVALPDVDIDLRSSCGSDSGNEAGTYWLAQS